MFLKITETDFWWQRFHQDSMYELNGRGGGGRNITNSENVALSVAEVLVGLIA